MSSVVGEESRPAVTASCHRSQGDSPRVRPRRRTDLRGRGIDLTASCRPAARAVTGRTRTAPRPPRQPAGRSRPVDEAGLGRACRPPSRPVGASGTPSRPSMAEFGSRSKTVGTPARTSRPRVTARSPYLRRIESIASAAWCRFGSSAAPNIASCSRSRKFDAVTPTRRIRWPCSSRRSSTRAAS